MMWLSLLDLCQIDCLGDKAVVIVIVVRYGADRE